MQAKKWITGLAVAAMLFTTAACTPQAAPGRSDLSDNDGRYGTKGTNLGPGTKQINVPRPRASVGAQQHWQPLG